MANVEKMSDALTPRRVQRAQAIKELGRHWDVSLASGESVDGEQAFARIRERLNAKLTAQSPQ
jgi:hypothetical protein